MLDQGEIAKKFIDVTGPDWVEVEIREDGEVLWVSIEGITVLRVCRPKNPIVITREITP